MIDSSHAPADSPAFNSRPPAKTRASAVEKLGLVIPTLREAENLSSLLDRIRAVLNPLGILYEIIVVDDDSRDGTSEIVSAIADEDPRVRLLVRIGESGLSGAILHGWQRTDATILGVMDADLQHPPELLPQMLSAISDRHDLVIGSRYTAGGDMGQWNPVRRLLSLAAASVTWPLQRPVVRVKDPMSGYFLVRSRGVSQINFQRTGFKLLLEILVRGQIESVTEVPFTFGLRSKGVSKANFKVAVEYGRLLANLYAEKIGLGFRAGGLSGSADED